MDLNKMNDAAKVDLCRKYFIIGLFGLPLVWLTNAIWFFGEGFLRPLSPATYDIRKYVTLSAVGVLLWFFLLFAWEFVFQSYRSQGLAWADYLTFIFPSGRI
ncbi:Gamma-secretase subunit PEN-2 [Trichostrongylus colubriformis]|uniref:Gamma-secretase subunit PEN-2 n=1 Tax=Trichostrongylus colubriformis TaxID=6319 RepID=A0AAN8J3I7_TRICO